MLADRRNEFQVEGDTVFVAIQGDVRADHLEALIEICEKIEAEHGYFLTLADVRQVGRVPSEIRRRSAEWGRHHRPGGYACYGSSAMTRTIITLLIRAISLVSKQDTPVMFFASEAEARKWLAVRRQQLAAGKH